MSDFDKPSPQPNVFERADANSPTQGKLSTHFLSSDPPVERPTTRDKPSLVDLIVQIASVPTPEGMAYIAETEANAPYRRVSRSTFNSAGFLASERMGKTQGEESHTLEYPLLIELEFDRRVKRYWAQPKPIVVRYDSSKGDRVATSYTADVLVELVDGRFAVIEAKPFARAEEYCGAGRYRSTT